MNTTEKVIFEQFPYWEKAITWKPGSHDAALTVIVGCGTSYNLALSLAAYFNLAGRAAIAVPGAEWLSRPEAFFPDWKNTHVIALSRSGESTETVAAAKASRAAGAHVTAITVEPESPLAKNCDTLVVSPSHPDEGIVMSVSASLMLLLGQRMIGQDMTTAIIDTARKLMDDLDAALPQLIENRSHFVFLGGGPLYGIALEGALKLMEMSQTVTQAFHPLEYRHGPISLVSEETAVVMLYSDQKAEEAKVVKELQDKGAVVIGLGGPGDLSLDLDTGLSLAGLAMLPALQILGERVAQVKGLDTVTPRHLTKVVKLA